MWVGLEVAAQPGAPMRPVLPDTVKMATLLLPPADVFDGGPAMRGPLFLATQAATALTPAELRRPGTADLGDVLEGLPGVDVRTRGPMGVQTDLSVRGGTFEQTALLVDGMRWSSVQTGHHLMQLPFDPEEVGHAVLTRGGTGAMLGVGALAGAISLDWVTPDTSQRAQLHVEGGSYGWSRVRVMAHAQTGRFAHRTALSRARSTGFAPNTDFLVTRGSWTTRANWGWRHRVQGFVGVEDKAFGAQGFYSLRYPHQFEATRATVAQVTYRRLALWSVFVGAHGRYHTDVFQLYREGAGWFQPNGDGVYVRPAGVGGAVADTAAAWYQGANRHWALTGAVSARASRPINRVRLDFGVDLRRDVLGSNVLGVASGGEAPFVLGAQRNQVESYASARYALGNGFRCSAALGTQWNDGWGWRVLPAADVSWHAQNQASWMVYASVGRSTRQPSWTDLYYQGGARGRADLQPESADQWELGWRGNSSRWGSRASARWEPWLSRWSGEVSVYQRRGRQLIDWVLLPGDSLYQAANLTRTDHRGLDASFRWVAPEDRTNLPLAFLRLSATWLEATQPEAEFASSYVLDIVDRKADVWSEWRLPDGGLPGEHRLQVVVTHQRRAGSFQDADGVEEPYGWLTLVGCGLSSRHRQGEVEVFVRVDNALDGEFRDFGGVPLPGRWWRAGVRWGI